MPDKTTDFLLLQEALGHIRQACHILEHLDYITSTADWFGDAALGLHSVEQMITVPTISPWYGMMAIPQEIAPPEDVRQCALCGCTEDHACPGGCSWVLSNLCSVCFQALRAAGIDVAVAAIPSSSVLGPSSSEPDADLPCPREFLT